VIAALIEWCFELEEIFQLEEIGIQAGMKIMQ
jgi:hypothetical protein